VKGVGDLRVRLRRRTLLQADVRRAPLGHWSPTRTSSNCIWLHLITATPRSLAEDGQVRLGALLRRGGALLRRDVFLAVAAAAVAVCWSSETCAVRCRRRSAAAAAAAGSRTVLSRWPDARAADDTRSTKPDSGRLADCGKGRGERGGRDYWSRPSRHDSDCRSSTNLQGNKNCVDC